MKILVTGGTGFIGQHVVRRFCDAGHTVRVLARQTSDTTILKAAGVEIVLGDLALPETLVAAVSGVDVVVSLAAAMSGTEHDFNAVTVQGTRSLFEAAERAGVKRVVHASSIAVLSMRSRPGEKEISEDSGYESDPRLQSAYIRAKQESEKFALSFSSVNGMQVVVLRPGLVFGPGGTWKLPRMGYPVGRRFLTIGHGRNMLPVTYVKNMADAILIAAARPVISTGPFNIIDNERFTSREFLLRFARDVNPQLVVHSVPVWIFFTIAWCARLAQKMVRTPNPFQLSHIVGSSREVVYSTLAARQQLGWEPRIGKEQALAETMQFFLEKGRIRRRADVKALSQPPSGDRIFNVVIIGCGAIAEMHAKFLAELPFVRLVACCDQDLSAAERFAAKKNISKVYASPELMLTEIRPEVVHILTPPQTNLELTLLAIRNGCHVVVEKPAAMNASQAAEMFRAASSKGVRLCVDHNHLYDRVMIEARRAVESGELGQITWIDSYYGFDLGNNRANRLMARDGAKNWNYGLPGGVFQNLLPHPLSVALDLLGEPGAIHAHARYFRVVPHQPRDELRILIETPAAGGLVTVSLAASPKFHTLTIYGTKGTLLVDFAHKLVMRQIHRSRIPKSASRLLMNISWGASLIRGTVRMGWKVARRKWIHFDGMGTLLAEFYSSLREDRAAPVTPEETLRVMRVMDETWKQIGRQDRAAKENLHDEK